MITTNFRNDFNHLLHLLKNKINFAFSRFSDGEMNIMQNLKLKLDVNIVQVGKDIIWKNYHKVDHKNFDPSIPEHQAFRESLISAYKHRQPNYFIGLSCRCCVGLANFKWMYDLHGPGNDRHLTWANLLVNGNYTHFIEQMWPELQDRNLVMVCHESADLSKFPVSLKAEFRVGYNAMINNLATIDDIDNYISDNNITDHVFLFSASSFSALAMHRLYVKYPNNTYLNIGTTLNTFMGMPVDRIYLQGYWNNDPAAGDVNKICVW